jgi:hypothetical protein
MSRSIAWGCAAAAALALSACERGVRFDARVENPAFAKGEGPKILFDEGHHNHHSIKSTYRPFAQLLANDGFVLDRLDGPVTPSELRGVAILAIVTAQADTDTNAEPAFTVQEIGLITDFVRRGGSLLLVIDHYPFANSVATLAHALGVGVAKGMTFDAVHHRRDTKDDSRLIFSRANGLLGEHAVIAGRNSAEIVDEIETFTGDAVRPEPGSRTATPLLKLSATATNRLGVPKVRSDGGDVIVDVEFMEPRPAAGWAQGLALELGGGRVVVLADAAMITAQEDGGRKIGMNAPHNENRQLLLNVMRWLGRAY